MLNNFSAKMVAATYMITQALAQMPHDCFLVTEMQHTLTEPDTEFVSDLPSLMANFKPGMRLSKVLGYDDMDFEGLLTGLSSSLYDPSTRKTIDMDVVGEVTDNAINFSSAEDLVANPIDRISIVKDEDGICDVVLWQGFKTTYLSQSEDCVVGEYGIEEIQYMVAPEAPLVGFHGRTDGIGLTALGLIFHDTVTPQCQHTHREVDTNYWTTTPIWESSAVSEKALSLNEKQRAKALESILLYNSLKKTRESKANIHQEIKELLAQNPLNFGKGNDKPGSKEQFEDFMDDYMEDYYDEEYDEEYEYLDNDDYDTEISTAQMFDLLLTKYQSTLHQQSESVRVTLGEIEGIYQNLMYAYGGPEYEFTHASPKSFAKVKDVQSLFRKIQERYQPGIGELKLDFDQIKTLRELFSKLLGMSPTSKRKTIQPNDEEYYEEMYGEEMDDEAEADYGDEVEEATVDVDFHLAESLQILMSEYPTTFALNKTPLPVSLGDVEGIYQNLVYAYGGPSYEFTHASPTTPATVSDLQILFKKVSERMNQRTGKLSLDLSQKLELQNLFMQLKQHYSQNDVHKSDEQAGQLYDLYDKLEQEFGKPEALTLAEAEVGQLYDMMQRDENFDLRVEGEMVSNFEDLKNLMRQKQDVKITSLLNEIEQLGEDENETMEYLDSIDEELVSEMDAIYDEIEDESARLTRIENFLRQQAEETQRINSLTPEEREGMAPLKDTRGNINALTPEEREGMAPLKDSSGTINALTPEEREGMAPLTNPLERTRPDQTTQSSEEPEVMSADRVREDEFIEHELHEMMLYILAAVAVAIIGGTCLGAIVVYCIMACCKSSQKKRLSKAQSNGDNFVFEEQNTETAGDKTKRLPSTTFDDESPSNMIQEQTDAKLQTGEAGVGNTVTEQSREDSEDEAEPAFLSARGLRFNEIQAARRATVDNRGNFSALSPTKTRRATALNKTPL